MGNRNQTIVQVTADGIYKLYHESGPFVDPEIRWGATGGATLRLGSRVAGIDAVDVLESWIHKDGTPAQFGDSTTDAAYPERSAVVTGISDMVIVEVTGFSQPFTIRVMDKRHTSTQNHLAEVEALPFIPIDQNLETPTLL